MRADVVDDPKDPRNRIDRISAAYDRAAEAKQAQAPAARDDRQGSDMVKASAPGMHLTPTGPMRAGPDRQSYNERLNAERDRESAKIDRAKEIADAVKNREADKSKDKEPER